MTELWWYLKSPNRPSIQGSSSSLLQTIELPDELSWPVGEDMQNILFVRPSQQSTPNRIMETYTEYLSDPKPRPNASTTGFIVKGTPGIGE